MTDFNDSIHRETLIFANPHHHPLSNKDLGPRPTPHNFLKFILPNDMMNLQRYHQGGHSCQQLGGSGGPLGSTVVRGPKEKF